MRILISGASGLMGSALVPFLRSLNHDVFPLPRRETGPAPRWDPATGQIHLDGSYDAVIHLAGENIAGRWTRAKRQRIVRSRVDGTRLLCEQLAALTPPPRVLLSASAIGFYGNRGEEWLVESSSAGTGFLSETAQAWEEATAAARTANIRVVCLRFGVVLAARGGALGKLLLPFRLGLGGRVGRGDQYWSWVSLEDVPRAIRHLLQTEDLAGPVNVVSPQPVTNAEFARTLGRVLKRPALFPLPALAVKVFLGQMGEEMLLASTRVRPSKLLESGFVFARPELEEALRAVLRRA